MTPAELSRETRSSIELERTAKQDYKWTIKVYFEDGHEAETLDTLERIDARLRFDYLPKPGEYLPKAGE